MDPFLARTLVIGAVGLAGVVFFFLYPRLWPKLFGAYVCTGELGGMAFWTLEKAQRYREGSHDPYCRGLQGQIVFEPGLLTRRESRDIPPSAWRR